MRISVLKASSAAAAAVLLMLGVAACGEGDGDSKKGGTVTVFDVAGGVDSLDPGYWYYQTDYAELGQTTQRWLYGWKPQDTKPTPDIAEDLPKVTNGGKTLTIKIKSGIKYSPPLQNSTVKTADVKYAMERCFLPQVGNGYAPAYYSEIEGAEAFTSGKEGQISGIQTPDDRTLVIKTAKPVGVLGDANALAMPCTVPVPKDYAQKYDKGKQSTYGEHQVFTGPYMIENDGKGKITGYEPGVSLTLVRNPSWDRSTDFRPANFDRIVVKGGNDITVASRKILSGQSLMSGDFTAPPPAVLKSALKTRKDQLDIAPSQGIEFISLNTKVKPFDDVNVRRALSAAIDRTALRQGRGGETLGPIATHSIPPDMPGFDEAGGLDGPGYDFVSSPTANIPLAMSYMKRAGYSSGKYEGPRLLVVADNVAPASQTAEAFQNQVEKLGFPINLREVPHATMLSKFCTVPKAAVAICPNLVWGKDFFDSQSMIDPLFNGKSIVPVGNTNTSQANDPELNAQMDRAESIIDPAERAKAWGELDRKITNQAYVLPWLWDNQINFASENVNGVKSNFNSTWDLTFSSLK